MENKARLLLMQAILPVKINLQEIMDENIL